MYALRPLRLSTQHSLARFWLAAVLVCALLVVQFGLNQHVVEHAAQATHTIQLSSAVTVTSPTASLDNFTHAPDDSTCLLCVEHKAHGSGMTSHAVPLVTETARIFAAVALAPNAPYLAPERASQRAPPQTL